MSHRSALLAVLRRGVRDGRLVLGDAAGRTVIGPPSGLVANVHVRDQRTYRAVLRHGSIGLADAYADGWWECDDLVGLIRLAARNAGGLDRLRRRLAPALVPAQRLGAALRRSTPTRARRDVAAHYDLSNELFALFLDESMTYSCAVFDRPDATLEEAQAAKLERICRKLGLGPGDHVLEIGTGWGGFAIHAAGRHGCRVTTTTISEAQRAEAQARVDAAGLADLVTVLGADYRELEGRWHRIVSIEMVEAVGWRNLATYLRTCGGLLADDGLFCLQAITIDDRAYEVEKGGRSFANTRIFPGGFLPSLEVLVRDTARHTPMHAVHLEQIGPHYAETLRCWAERLKAGRDRLGGLGFDARFERLWRFYLAYTEAGFRERRIGAVQLVLGGPAFRGETQLLGRVGRADAGGAGRAAAGAALSAG